MLKIPRCDRLTWLIDLVSASRRAEREEHPNLPKLDSSFSFTYKDLVSFWGAEPIQVAAAMLDVGLTHTTCQWTFLVHLGLVELSRARGHEPRLTMEEAPHDHLRLFLRGVEVGLVNLAMLNKLESIHLRWEKRRRARLEPVADAILDAATFIR